MESQQKIFLLLQRRFWLRFDIAFRRDRRGGDRKPSFS